MNEVEFLIIGGGPAGLGAACRLQQKNKDWHLLEAEDHVGGLSSSFVDENGFTWDLGGHVQFSHYDTFDHYMDLKFFLEDRLGTRVDLVLEDTLKPLLRKHVERELIYV